MNIRELQHLKPQANKKLPRSDEGQLWRASSLSKCLRLQLLEASGLPMQRDAQFERFMSVRTGAHDKVLEWINETYENTDTELRVTDKDLRCGGSIDSIIHDGDDLYMIDVKTVGKFVKTKDKPYWRHQLAMYKHCLEDDNPGKNVVAIVLQVDFEGNITVLEPELDDEYLNIIEKLNLYWDADMLPDMQSSCGEFDDCQKCRLYNVCTEPVDVLSEYVEIVKRSMYNE